MFERFANVTTKCSRRESKEYNILAEIVRNVRLPVIDARVFPFKSVLVKNVRRVYYMINPRDKMYLHLMGKSVVREDILVRRNDVLEVLASTRRSAIALMA